MYLPYVFKELKRRKARTTTNILTVAIVTTILILLTSVMAAYSLGMYLPFKDISSNMVLQKQGNVTTDLSSAVRPPFGRAVFGSTELQAISSLDHVTSISSTLIVWDFGKAGFVSIEGIELGSPLSVARSTGIEKGRFLQESESKKAVLESHFARFNSLKVGDTITLGNETFAVIGIMSAEESGQVFSSNAYIGAKDAQRLSGVSGYNQVYLTIDDLSNEDVVKEKIDTIGSNIIAMSGDSVAAAVGNVVGIYNKFYLIGIGFVMLVAALILMKVNALGLIERKRDIGVMQSVGWTRREISKQITLEMLIQSFFGFILGAAMSLLALLLMGSITVQVVANGLQDSAEITVLLNFPTLESFFYLMIIMAVSLTVSFLLMHKTSNQKPVENLNSV